MNLADTLVVLDTCVLLRPRVADVIMDLRAEGVFSVHWTENIEAEFVRNMNGIYGVPRAKVENRMLSMKARCPEWEVLMSSVDFDAVPGEVDRKDRHVAAAALALRHAADKDAEIDEPGQRYDVILATENIKDFARKPMAGFGVRVLRVGALLDETYEAGPEAATRAVLRAANELQKPPYTVAELLHVLRKAGARTLVSGMSKALGVKPVPKEAASRR